MSTLQFQLLRRRISTSKAFVALLMFLAIAVSIPFATWVSGQDQDEISRRDFMRTKLMYSQNIMEGLTTRNFKLIKQGAEEINTITKATGWLVADTKEYAHYSEDLRDIADKIAKAADEKNLDAAAMRYFQMTANCIDCHDYSRANKFY
jgi:hypothetical protein